MFVATLLTYVGVLILADFAWACCGHSRDLWVQEEDWLKEKVLVEINFFITMNEFLVVISKR